METIDPAELKALTQRIINSGELGRSKTYAAILDYLVDCSIAGETPKETAIAVDVLGREADFDVGRDSIVRVHIYHLRNKLQTYFAKYGDKEKYRLEIPKGQYLITTRVNDESSGVDGAAPAAARSFRKRVPLTAWLTGAAAVLLLLNLLVLWRGGPAGEGAGPHQAVAGQSPWSAILDDQTPILVVMGDYFIFGELDEAGNVDRMVREFDINSAEDLATLRMLDPELADRYYDLGLTYIPNGAASALMSVMPLLHDEGGRLSMKMMSDLNASDLTSNHVIYLGYISGLGILRDLMFSSSGLEVGGTYDELRNRDNGNFYVSESAIRNSSSQFSDYGMISTFPSPRGHQLVMIAGMRDAGLINAAQEITSAGSLRALAQEIGEDVEAGAWEALYEVHGFDHTNFDARRVYTNTLRPGRIWSGEL